MKHNVDRLAQIETEARRMAHSGAYLEFNSISGRLQERGYLEAKRIFKNPWTQEEINRLCRLATNRLRAA